MPTRSPPLCRSSAGEANAWSEAFAVTGGPSGRLRLLLPLHISKIPFDVLRRLRVGIAERVLDRGHVGLRPGREVVVDGVEEFEARREANVGDRHVVAADEGLAVEIEFSEHLERLADRRSRRLLRLVLGGGVGVARADLAWIVRKAERAVGRAGEI